PEAALRVWELHPPVGRPPAPWPFIKAIRAPALAVLTAAIVFSLGLDRDDPDYQDGIEHFPDLEDRIRLAIVVARCGLFCAQVEADVKNRLYPGTRNDPDTFWPQGVRRELTRHQTALVPVRWAG
ncbi:MAG: hypothetical protein Q4P24_16575, partial [Rhodobacterales bacterium]|nr:hypothetical protein [Rhodobacterales bacterium]